MYYYFLALREWGGRLEIQGIRRMLMALAFLSVYLLSVFLFRRRHEASGSLSCYKIYFGLIVTNSFIYSFQKLLFLKELFACWVKLALVFGFPNKK